ncbi:MAG TPA: hypothetical protein VGB18_06225, partial [Candidatus Thermoplasmatota archaeon]
MAIAPRLASGPTLLRRHDGTVLFPAQPEILDVATVEELLSGPRTASSPIIMRLAWPDTSLDDAYQDLADVVRRLAPLSSAFTIDMPTMADRYGLELVAAEAKRIGKPILAVVRTDQSTTVTDAQAAGIDGLWVRGGATQTGDHRVFGRAELDACTEMVRRIRAAWPNATIVAGAGIVEPGDALAVLAAGADLAAFDAGLLLAGPGLPKRTNEALLAERQAPRPTGRRAIAIAGSRWTALALLGAMLIMSGVLAALVAIDRVVLPYDEEFLHASRDEIQAINDRLIPFLSHDRIALASTTVAIGTLYIALAVHGARTGALWPRTIIVASAVPGFASFLLYSLYGYFDPLDARATVLMFLVFLLGVILPNVASGGLRVPDLRNDRVWLRSLVGQTGFVGLGIGFIVAGLT